MKKYKLLFYLLVAVFVAFIFRSWFLPFPLSTGDWSYKFPQTIREFNLYPYAWSGGFGNGLGGNDIFLLALNTYFFATTSLLFNYLHIPWVIIEKVLWYWPYLVVSILGSLLLFRKFIIKDDIFALLSSLIFSVNTYPLMIMGGGQVGVGMGYAILPLVFWSFLKVLENPLSKNNYLKDSVLAGLIFSLQLLFDLRLAYVSVVFIGFYYLFYLYSHELLKLLKKTFVPFVIVPAVTTVFLHFFWIFPFVLYGQNPLSKLGEAFSGTGIISFLSFAKFENTISLLHPNWPENLFGKAYFMRPEFLIIPALAFSSLIFISKRNDKSREIIFLAFLGLVGAFLAKGSNDPFGTVYVWAFEKIPGFMMFRDSTKWYGMIALSYSLLIPYLIYKVSRIPTIKKKIPNIKYLLVIIFVLLWGIILRQSFTGGLEGTFLSKSEPKEYMELASFLSSQNKFYRTLWVPSFHQYTYYSDSHPAVSGADYYNTHDPKLIASKIQQNIKSLVDSSVKYIVVPVDTEGKIFLNNRKYSEDVYAQTVSSLIRVNEIKEVRRFGKIVVFEIPSTKDHFWSQKRNFTVSYDYINPTKYSVSVKNATKGDVLVFTEGYDKYWVIQNSGFRVGSLPFKDTLNSFTLPNDGLYSFEVYYQPQTWVNAGLVVSVFAGILVVYILIKYKK